MDLTTAFSQDFVSWDGTEAVTYESDRRAIDSPRSALALRNPNQADTIPIAKRRALTRRELQASLGAYTSGDLVWLLPAAVLPSWLAPKPGDAIVDSDENRWTALEVQANKGRQTFRLTTRNLTLAYDLRDLVDVERAGLVQDPSGATIKQFPTGPGPRGGQVIYQGLPARVQLQTQAIADERGIRGFKGSYAVILSREVVVTNEDRIRLTIASTDGLPAGTYLEIRDYHQAQQIGQLPVIAAEKAV